MLEWRLRWRGRRGTTSPQPSRGCRRTISTSKALGRETALAGVPVIPFVKAVQARLPTELEPAFHKGATTQDVLDTALALQMRDALALIEADLVAVMDGLARLAREHGPRLASGAPMASSGADHLRVQGRGAGSPASRRRAASALPGSRSRRLARRAGGDLSRPRRKAGPPWPGPSPRSSA